MTTFRARKRATAGEPVNELWPLPEGWEWKTLADICEPSQYGWTTRAAGSGELKFLRTTDISSGRLDWETVPFCQDMPEDVDRYVVREGDILISRAGSVGKSFLLNHVERAAFASYLIRYRPLAEPRYVYHWLQTSAYWAQIADNTAGIAVPNVNASKLDRIAIPMPPPETQRRIVARIDELFSELGDGEEELARAHANLETYRNALLRAAVTGEMTADWRADNPNSETGLELIERIQYDQLQSAKRDKRHREGTTDRSEAPSWLPAGWGWTTVRQLTEFLTSGSRGWSSYYSDEGATFIRAQNINRDYLNLDDVAFVSLPNQAEGTRSFVRSGDLLITITGANVTKTALVDRELGEAYVSQHVALLRLHRLASSAFAWLWLVTPAGGRRQLEAAAYGAGKPGLNLPNILDVSIPFPSLGEQEEICRRCDAALSDATSLRQDIPSEDGLAILRQSILAAAFRGKLAQ